MKKLLTIILVASSFFATAQVKISALPAATDTPALSSLTAIVESGTTKKATLQKLKNAILKNVTASAVNGWGTTGNSGTNPATDFIGTTDGADLTLKTNNIERSRFSANGQWITKLSFLPNDSFLVSVTSNALGLGLGAARLQHATLDGQSGAVALDGSGFGKTRNYSVFGFTNYGAKNSFLETGYDSTSRLAWLQLQVQNNLVRYTVRLASDTGLRVNCPLVYTPGTQGAGKALTSDVNGLASWGLVLDADTFTPTVTAVTNIDSITAYPCNYMRVGNTVTVSGQIKIQLTGSGAYEVGVSLPIASDFTEAYQCAGVLTGVTSIPAASDVGYINADTTNDRMSLNGDDNDGVYHQHYFTVTYTIQ